MTSKRRYGLTQTRDEAWHGVVASRRPERFDRRCTDSGRRSLSTEWATFKANAHDALCVLAAALVLGALTILFLIAGNQGVGK